MARRLLHHNRWGLFNTVSFSKSKTVIPCRTVHSSSIHHQVLSGLQLQSHMHSSAVLQKDDWIFSESLRPHLDMQDVCNNTDQIAENIRHRKGDADVYQVVELWKKFKHLEKELSDLGSSGEEDDRCSVLRGQVKEAESEFFQSACKLPNRTHPDAPFNMDDEPKLVALMGRKPTFNFPVKSHIELGENLNIIRIKNLGHITGHRSYFLKGAAAMLEHALIRFTVDRLLSRGFRALSVPDLVQPLVFEGCGMRTKGLHTQVYKLDRRKHDRDLCLSGTAEVGLAGYFMDRVLDQTELPQKVFAISQCFRAETTHSAEARGLYRVHQFTKVEMFCVSTEGQSEGIFKELVSIQQNLFTELGLHFQVLDMPSHDLGAPAYRKYDIEAWMPARQSYGEISSASNCTDYQSRRLKIQYRMNEGDVRHAYTLNGTACAVPRMILTILECNQQRDGSILIPKVLQPYMNGQTSITKSTSGLLHYTRL
ncbi:serine--tRNA ligase, mitochondrial-like [Asterias rubens]|uniref:serine--tRNA ligase, mitochondrial-like n=1 Tax=Asterias rubens TaxID=7604 RepID=UPI0014550F95|nr:serine--tRNA ligase, mitochondrial-like [Asterias rubens]XP_033624757.1 serine--tRNA ligase, mitochondrial-like [Asterias rubens]